MTIWGVGCKRCSRVERGEKQGIGMEEGDVKGAGR